MSKKVVRKYSAIRKATFASLALAAAIVPPVMYPIASNSGEYCSFCQHLLAEQLVEVASTSWMSLATLSGLSAPRFTGHASTAHTASVSPGPFARYVMRIFYSACPSQRRILNASLLAPACSLCICSGVRLRSCIGHECCAHLGLRRRRKKTNMVLLQPQPGIYNEVGFL